MNEQILLFLAGWLFGCASMLLALLFLAYLEIRRESREIGLVMNEYMASREIGKRLSELLLKDPPPLKPIDGGKK